MSPFFVSSLPTRVTSHLSQHFVNQLNNLQLDSWTFWISQKVKLIKFDKKQIKTDYLCPSLHLSPEWKSENITYLLNGLTGVGTRDACASKNLQKHKYSQIHKYKNTNISFMFLPLPQHHRLQPYTASGHPTLSSHFSKSPQRQQTAQIGILPFLFLGLKSWE